MRTPTSPEAVALHIAPATDRKLITRLAKEAPDRVHFSGEAAGEFETRGVFDQRRLGRVIPERDLRFAAAPIEPDMARP
jgi:hypothetical protein